MKRKTQGLPRETMFAHMAAAFMRTLTPREKRDMSKDTSPEGLQRKEEADAKRARKMAQRVKGSM